MCVPRILGLCIPTVGLLGILACSCNNEDSALATVQIQNDFNDPQITGFQPPWTLCKSSYRGIDFGKIDIGATSAARSVSAGLDYVLMVAAWDDPTCNPANCLPIASKNEEEVVAGQSRTIAIGMPNHQGPCPPEGVPPIPETQYNRILQLWPEYGFRSYGERTLNTQCGGAPATDAGAEPDDAAANEVGPDGSGDPDVNATAVSRDGGDQ